MTGVSVAAEREFPEERATTYLPEQMRAIRWQLYVGFIGLAIGGYAGLLQALERILPASAGTTLYQDSQLKSYYQGLTLHGVLLALVFTFSFGNSFLSFTTMRGFERRLASTALVQGSFWLMVAGVILAAYTILTNQATVLFTFYTPLRANPLLYLGAVFIIVSTWLVSANQLLTYRAWRRDHPDERIPILAYMSIMTYLMWDIASIGVAVEVLGFVLPWSLGWMSGTDPQFNRILFWFTGHPIVYFWLLPAYVSWYAMIPRQVGGRLYSDGLTRLVFIMFLLFSAPVGVHHQYTDPGISQAMKAVFLVLTFVVIVPSFITAFSIMASLEDGGRKAGGKGMLGWIPRLPWNNPSVTAQLLAMLVFALGGATGIINASYTVNLMVHNTSFVPGHFHLTVGTGVALSVMGITYWWVPHLTGRALFGRRLALAQAWLWAIGVLIFARGQIAGGLENMPRRTAIGAASYSLPGWTLSDWFTGIGGIIMVVSGILFFVVLLGTLFASRPLSSEVEVPIAEVKHGPKESWRILDRMGFWVVIAIVLILLTYGPLIATYLPLNLTSPTFKPY